MTLGAPAIFLRIRDFRPPAMGSPMLACASYLQVGTYQGTQEHHVRQPLAPNSPRASLSPLLPLKLGICHTSEKPCRVAHLSSLLPKHWCQWLRTRIPHLWLKTKTLNLVVCRTPAKSLISKGLRGYRVNPTPKALNI